MNVEQSIVHYTLTMRAESGETVVANGRLPNDAMDHFMVINQYIKNPTENLIQESQLHHSQADMTAPYSILETDNMSPILPSSPTHLEDDSFAKDCLGQELRKQYGFPAGSSEKPVEEIPVARVPFSELAVMQQLQQLHRYSGPDIKEGIIQAVQDYLSENNVNLLDYCTLCEFMKELFYQMIILHINDNKLVDKIIEMLYLAGEQPHAVTQYRNNMYRQYALLYRVATYYKLTMDSTSFASYQAWKKTNYENQLDRWNLMKTFLESKQ
jgi:predicted amino acid-binding ACT domain protein